MWVILETKHVLLDVVLDYKVLWNCMFLDAAVDPVPAEWLNVTSEFDSTGWDTV